MRKIRWRMTFMHMGKKNLKMPNTSEAPTKGTVDTNILEAANRLKKPLMTLMRQMQKLSIFIFYHSSYKNRNV